MEEKTLGELINDLVVSGTKMWDAQELLYEIRRMTFDEYKAKFFSSEEGSEKLWQIFKNACDLNIERNNIMDQIDQTVIDLVKSS
jgi:hypothetical protein